MAREPWRAEVLMREHVSGVKSSLVKSLIERGEQADIVNGSAAG
jgi:GntR family transcriptional regulator of vanillate catabolism